MSEASPTADTYNGTMFGVIVYLGATMAVSGLLTLFWAVIRPVHDHGEMRSWRIWMALFFICNLLPYGAFEVQTTTFGDDMKDAVEEVIENEEIDGDLAYYKVLFCTGKSADIVVVAQEPSSWGGTDRPVIRAKLSKSDGKWALESSHIVYSDNRNMDGVVFPPFW